MVNRKKSKLNLIDKIVLYLNIVSVITLLLAYLSPLIDPREFSIIALLGFAYQALLLVNILFVIYWLIRFRVIALISTISILLGFPIITENFGFNFWSDSNKSKSLDNIRLMEYNVHELFGLQRFEHTSILDSVARVVHATQPDIINFEEFYFKKSDSIETINSIQKALRFKYFYFKSFKNNRLVSSGNAIFTRFPIIDSGMIHSADFLNTKAIFADVRYENKIFRIYCVHLAAVEMQEDDKRKYLNGKVNLGILSFIQSRLIKAFSVRNYQVDKIKENISKCPYPYIIAGDFNDTPISYAVNAMSDGLKNAFIEKGSGLGTTYYSTFPKLHIDYILVSPQFDVLSYQTINKKLSDHRPIFSDLRLNK